MSARAGRQPFRAESVTHVSGINRYLCNRNRPAATGTLATIRTWDMPQLGILNVMAEGATRIEVRSHEIQADGLVVGQVSPIAPEASIVLPARHRPLAELLRLLIARIDPQHLAETRAYEDASWVGFRLAELLPLPL